MAKIDIATQVFIDRYNAFEPGGAVRRLLDNLKLTPSGYISATRTDSDALKPILAELEKLCGEKK